MNQREFLTFLNVNGIPYSVCETLKSKFEAASCGYVTMCVYAFAYY